MNAQRMPWRFYGRQTQMEELAHDLEFIPDRHNVRNGRRQFSTCKIRGRRGLGKTALVLQLQAKAPSDLPIIYLELPNPDNVPTDGDPINVEAIARRITELAEGHGSVPVRFGERVHRRLAAGRAWKDPHFKFQALLQALIKEGGVVVFDEFHLAKKLGLVTDIREVIRNCHDVGRKLDHPGKLVLMGSHQQELQSLFASDAPLYGTTNAYLHLHPWSLRTTMRVAAEHDILPNPGKFLTLWTAYGGSPRNWQRYCTDERYAPLHAINDEDEWRRGFLAAERNFLTEWKERFDARTTIELREPERRILLWVGHHHPRGIKLKDIPVGDYADKLAAVQMLETDLDLMSSHGPLLVRDHSRWKISDQYTLFQLHVFPELMAQADDQKIEGLRGRPELARLLSLEGVGLETLATTFMGEQDGVTWHQSNVWHPRIAREGDIDVMAANVNTEPWTVWLGEAKRNENDLYPGMIKAFQDRFLTTLGNSDEAKKIRTAKLQRQLFATTFPRGSRERLRSAGFEAVDLHAMARSFGIEPWRKPVAANVPAEPEEENKPTEPPRPRMGM